METSHKYVLARHRRYMFLVAAILLYMSGFTQQQNVKTGYAPVNGLKMYYEVSGSGRPLVLIHGAYMSIQSAFGKLIPTLSRSRQVIAVELQGHARTGDINRSLTYEQLADDVAALLKHLKVDSADIFGYSLGGGVALQMGIRHPAQVRKLVVASGAYKTSGWHPDLVKMIPTLTPEMFEGSPWKKEYDSLAPNPKNFPALVMKLKKLDMTPYDWKAETIKSVKAPILIIIGDADAVQPDHAVNIFRLKGGGVMGDLTGLPTSQLAVLPGTHHVGVMERTDWLLSMVPAFLDAPATQSN